MCNPRPIYCSGIEEAALIDGQLHISFFVESRQGLIVQREVLSRGLKQEVGALVSSFVQIGL